MIIKSISGTLTLLPTQGNRPYIGEIDLIFTGTGSFSNIDTVTTDYKGNYTYNAPANWTGILTPANNRTIFLDPTTLSGYKTDGSAYGVAFTTPVTSSVVQNVTVWTAPIGIPAPEFGITESHWMYVGQTYDFGAGPVAYPDAGNGPYTHYVDNTDPEATDTGNTYGTPLLPRKTIPLTNQVSGSVLEIHGGPYTYSSGGVLPLGGNGTLERPVFIRGVDNPSFITSIRVRGTYIIVENLNLATGAMTNSVGITIDHACIRYNDFGNVNDSAFGIASYTSTIVTDVVVFDNIMHDLGDMESPTDDDYCGINVNALANRVWLIDNLIFNTDGSGVQVNAGSLAAQADLTAVYVARNLVHDTRQAGIAAKQCVDCVFSQNHCYDAHNTSWSPSKGIGYQYGPERLWILFNEIHDCAYGIRAGGTSGLGFGQNAYIIGNVVHRIHHVPEVEYNPNTGWSNAGIMLVGVPNQYIVDNTICEVDAGINNPSSGAMYMDNNIISNVVETGGQHIFIETATTTSTLNNSLLYQSDGAVRIRWGSGIPYTLAGFQAATGKGQNCIEADPMFVEPELDNFHLQSLSPAISLADQNDVYTVFENLYGISIRKDIDGKTRPSTFKYTVGSYEYTE